MSVSPVGELQIVSNFKSLHRLASLTLSKCVDTSSSLHGLFTGLEPYND